LGQAFLTVLPTAAAWIFRNIGGITSGLPTTRPKSPNLTLAAGVDFLPHQQRIFVTNANEKHAGQVEGTITQVRRLTEQLEGEI
jgi:hypothetical protein